jgi:hypothetical protein
MAFKPYYRILSQDIYLTGSHHVFSFRAAQEKIRKEREQYEVTLTTAKQRRNLVNLHPVLVFLLIRLHFLYDRLRVGIVL